MGIEMINLLIVDDEQATRTILKSFVDFEKFNIRLIGEVENGEEAIDFFQGTDIPNILITDMNMPVMDGISLIEYVANEFADVKIIVASGYFEYQYTKAALQNGAIDYLLKPIDDVELNQVIEKCVNKIQEERTVEKIIHEDKKNVHFQRKEYRYILEQLEVLMRIIEEGNEIQFPTVIENLMTGLTEDEFIADKEIVLFHLILGKLNDYCIHNNIELSFQEELQIDTREIDFIETITNTYKKYFAWKKGQESTIEIIETIKNYIDIHYRENLYSGELAEQFHISKEYMSSLFSSTYQVTMSKYINTLKMENAKKQLIYGNRSIKDISFGLGFEDDNYFCRVFKKMVGVTPSKYRSENKK
ncbi:MAG: response regulator [Eubacteriales bacterium]